MKNTVLYIGLILATFLVYSSNAQSGISHRERRADRHFENHSYYKASELYKKVVKNESKNDRARLKLARTYFLANNPAEAEFYFGLVIHKKYLVKSLDYLHYAQVLQSMEKFQRAESWGRKYLEINPRNIVAQNLIYSLENISKYYKDSSRYVVEVLNINTESSEFSPSFYREGIVFVSSRSKKHSLKRDYSRDGSKFLNLYYSENLLGNEMMTTPEKIKGVNTRYHQGSATFYQGHQKMIYTSNSSFSSQDGDRTLKLYTASFSKKKNRWQNISLLSINREKYSFGHPTMSADEKVLYFVSDMPGGIGGTDLYKVSVDGDGWGSPVNLGNTINTPGNEMFPYVDSNNRLYFSSNGHGGLGGLDIFFVNLNQLNSKVQNIGFPINSTRDDFGLIYDEHKALGYFSSDRAGQSDLYQYSDVGVCLKILVQNEFLEPISSGQVWLQSQGHKLDMQIPGQKGDVTFYVSPGEDYQIVAESDGYEVIHTTISSHESDFEFAMVMTSNKPAPAEGTLLVIAGIESSKSYVITPDQVIEVKDPGTNGDSNWLSDLLVFNNIQIEQTIEINPIHYAFNKSSIESKYTSELDKLAMLMNKFDFIEFELGAHTDATGSDHYNQLLSEKRANGVLNYLHDMQINTDRLVAIGYGESNPAVVCADQQPCVPYPNHINRRTEFRLIYINDNQVVSNY